MKYNDASSLEERNENNLYEIHFYFEGDWWRAYEWSAYLATHYKTSEVSSLVPTKKSWSGNEDGIVLVGLKTQSFKKYFPELDVEYLISDKKEVVIKYNDILKSINEHLSVNKQLIYDDGHTMYTEKRSFDTIYHEKKKDIIEFLNNFK